MPRQTLSTIAARSVTLSLMLVAILSAQSQATKTPYPAMAPVEQYLMDRDAEIALARSAAPASISKDAEVMVLTRHGYETAVKGSNGFVCVVERGWTGGSDFSDFWNPRLRGPICFNAAAARTYLPRTLKKTEWVMAGQSKAQMYASLKIAFDKKELAPIETGAMCYMLSKQGYLNDQVAHWHPHLMFFVPQTDPKTWAANLDDSPIFGQEFPEDHMTIFFVPIATWSDGTTDSPHQH